MTLPGIKLFDLSGRAAIVTGGSKGLGQAMAGKLADRAEALVAEGARASWYERAIRDLVLAEPDAFGWEDVTGLPWLEIDFPADVARAEAEVLPRLEPLPS